MYEIVSRSKNIAFSAVLGAAVVFLLELAAALLAEKEILPENLFSAAAASAVFVGAFVSSVLAGGKIYGALSSAVLLLVLLLAGVVFIPGNINTENAMICAAGASAGAAAGIFVRALIGKK